jgi:serine/threonine protein kinase
MDFLNHANTPKKLPKQLKTPTTTTLLAQGTYGCVYYPGFTCTGKLQKTNYISKLQKMNETVKNEIEIGEKIRQIKNHPYYFAPIISECPISIKKLQENFAQPLSECKIINEEKKTGGKGTIKQSKRKDTQEFVINKIKYILGEDLDKTLEEKKLSTNVPNTETITFLLDTYDYLSKSLQKLKSKNILHYDLKSNNIIYDKISNIPIIIDFGLSIQLDKINSQNPDPEIIYQYFFDTYEYDFWCLEPIFIGMYSKNIPPSETKENYNQQTLSSSKYKYTETIDNYINYVYIFKPEFITKLGQIFPTQSPIQQKIQTLPKTFYEKWHQYLKEHESDTNSTFFQTLWNARFTWDYYSLAVIYLEFISKLNLSPLNNGTRSETKMFQQLELFTDFLLNQILSLPHERKNS